VITACGLVLLAAGSAGGWFCWRLVLLAAPWAACIAGRAAGRAVRSGWARSDVGVLAQDVGVLAQMDIDCR